MDGCKVRAKTVYKLEGQISGRVGNVIVGHFISPTFEICSECQYRDAGMMEEGEEVCFLLLVRCGGPFGVEGGHGFV